MNLFRPESHRWCWSMARVAGVSPATVGRIWDAAGLQPHRVETFKVSNDPKFLEKLTDVVGLPVIDAIQAYLEAYNEDPNSFVWTATVGSIVEKVNRRKAILQAAH